jgi:acyl-CoA thioesterase FadM
MNMAYYVQCFEESSDFVLEHAGLGYDYAINQQKGVFVIKCEINYKREIKQGEKFIISLIGLTCKGKKLILKFDMIDNQNSIFANYEILNLNIDLKTKKSVTFEDTIIKKLS